MIREIGEINFPPFIQGNSSNVIKKSVCVSYHFNLKCDLSSPLKLNQRMKHQI